MATNGSVPVAQVRRRLVKESPLAESYDLPIREQASFIYFLAFLPRSGSTFCATHLWKTGLLGAPLEYLNFYYDMVQLIKRFNVESLDGYLKEVIRHRTTPNGSFGLKLTLRQLRFLQGIEFRHNLHPQRWIFMDRRDKISQAVSFSIAIQTREWSSLGEQINEPTYSFDFIQQRYSRLIQDRNFWDSYFLARKIQPIRIDYEDFAAEPATFVSGVLKNWNVPSSPSYEPKTPQLERQHGALNEEWRMRFSEDLSKRGHS